MAVGNVPQHNQILVYISGNVIDLWRPSWKSETHGTKKEVGRSQNWM